MKIKTYEEPLREQYAGQAMAALIQCNFSHNAWELARQAFQIADAMIDVKRETESESIEKAKRDYEVFSQS